MGGGAWPFLVGGVICLVNSDNERDSVLLNSVRLSFGQTILLRGTGNSWLHEKEQQQVCDGLGCEGPNHRPRTCLEQQSHLKINV